MSEREEGRAADSPPSRDGARASDHVGRSGWLAGLLVLAILVAQSTLAVASLPALYPISTHDGILHIFRAAEMEICLLDGNWYPRWSPNFAQGLGYPVFNFYAPFASYLQIWLHWLGLTFQDAFRAEMALAVIAGAGGMYLLTAAVAGRMAGLFAALLYVCSPFVQREIFVRGDLPELLALAVLPFVLWSARRLVLEQGLSQLVLFSASYAMLVLSHNLTAFFASPFILLYGAIWLLPQRRLRPWLYFAGGLALAVALSAFYWVPALGELAWVQIDRSHGYAGLREIDFRTIQDLIRFQLPVDQRQMKTEPDIVLGVSMALFAVLGLLATLLRQPGRAVTLHALYCLGCGAFLLFLINPLSQPLWELLPVVNIVQFPWRMLGIAGVPIASLGGLTMLLLPRLTDTRPKALLAGLGVALATLFVLYEYLFYPYHLFPPGPDQVSDNPTVAEALGYEQWSHIIGTTSTQEFLPRWSKWVPNERTVQLEVCEECVPKELIDRGTLPATVKVQQTEMRSNYHAFEVEAERSETLLFRLLYYPAWHAYLDGVEAPTEPTALHDLGWLSLKVPAGTHRVELRFENTPLVTASNTVSLAAVALASLLLIVASQWRRRRAGEETRPLPPWWLALLMPLLVLLVLAFKLLWIDGHTNWFRYSGDPNLVPRSQAQMVVPYGDEVLLRGYRVMDRNREGIRLISMRTYWQPLQQIEQEYWASVQVFQPGGEKPVAGAEWPLPDMMRRLPYQAGVYYPVDMMFNLQPELPSGDYELYAFLKRASDGQALPVKGSSPERFATYLGPLRLTD